jgi:hypothetical protein
MATLAMIYSHAFAALTVNQRVATPDGSIRCPVLHAQQGAIVPHLVDALRALLVPLAAILHRARVLAHSVLLVSIHPQLEERLLAHLHALLAGTQALELRLVHFAQQGNTTRPIVNLHALPAPPENTTLALDRQVAPPALQESMHPVDRRRVPRARQGVTVALDMARALIAPVANTTRRLVSLGVRLVRPADDLQVIQDQRLVSIALLDRMVHPHRQILVQVVPKASIQIQSIVRAAPAALRENMLLRPV